MKCPKKGFPDSKSAVSSLRSLRRKQRRTFEKYGVWHKTPIRAYQCDDCGQWHLTSQYQRQ